MVLQNYQNFIEMTSNMICIVALGVGLKCPQKIHLIERTVGGIVKKGECEEGLGGQGLVSEGQVLAGLIGFF